MRHARSSPLNCYRHVRQTSPSRRQPRRINCLTYFWCLAEAEWHDDLDNLWPDFDQRSRELVALARAKDIKSVLHHLTAAVRESRLLNQRPMPDRKIAILEAISTAAVVS
jgi:hypothetical protein